jgi:hypothetical protein
LCNSVREVILSIWGFVWENQDFDWLIPKTNKLIDQISQDIVLIGRYLVEYSLSQWKPSNSINPQRLINKLEKKCHG